MSIDQRHPRDTVLAKVTDAAASAAAAAAISPGSFHGSHLVQRSLHAVTLYGHAIQHLGALRRRSGRKGCRARRPDTVLVGWSLCPLGGKSHKIFLLTEEKKRPSVKRRRTNRCNRLGSCALADEKPPRKKSITSESFRFIAWIPPRVSPMQCLVFFLGVNSKTNMFEYMGKT